MTEHRVLNGSLLDPTALPELMRGELADAIYSDPPWGPGLLATFGAMAGRPQRGRWVEFVEAFALGVHAHARIGAPVFVEMGLRWADEVCAALSAAGRPVTRRWAITYRTGAKLLPATLLYSGPDLPEAFDPAPLRGPSLPQACLAASAPPRDAIVLDPCCGKGYTARACMALGISFRGLELNASRLEVTRRWLASR